MEQWHIACFVIESWYHSLDNLREGLDALVLLLLNLESTNCAPNQAQLSVKLIVKKRKKKEIYSTWLHTVFFKKLTKKSFCWNLSIDQNPHSCPYAGDFHFNKVD